MRDAYTGEFVEFAVAIRECRKPSATGFDARRALAVALGVHRVRADPRPGRSCAGKFVVACGMRAAAPPTVRACQNTHFRQRRSSCLPGSE